MSTENTHLREEHEEPKSFQWKARNMGDERIGIYPDSTSCFSERIGIYPDDTTCCGECCTLTCDLCGLGLAHCFCIRPASRLCRIALVCSWTVLVTLASVLIVKYGLYGSGSVRISPTDEKQITDHLSSFWCRGFQLVSPNPFNVYRFEGEPQINISNTVKYDWKKTIFIDGKTKQSRDFYLLKGSVATVKTCADNLVSFCVIKGERDFQRWRTQSYCPECCQTTLFVSGRSCEKLSVTASESDNFYFVFNKALYPTWIDVDIHLIRTSYDSERAVESCHRGSACDLSLSYLSKETVVVQGVPDGDSDSIIHTHCVTRSYIYVLVFATPAIIIMCSLSMFIHCKSKEITESSPRAFQRYRPPTTGYETFRYQTFDNLQPPGYEQTSRTFSPPSYQEVVSSDSPRSVPELSNSFVS